MGCLSFKFVVDVLMVDVDVMFGKLLSEVKVFESVVVVKGVKGVVVSDF